MKLNIGCGPNPLPGWINTDLHCIVPNVIQMNAAGRFPFEDNSFSHVFSEHMIEHVTYQDGLVMLRECFRVLEPDGWIRISTPSWEFLISLLTVDSEINRRYIHWSHEIFCSGQPRNAESVVNNFVRAWGHQYIYSEKSLTLMLRQAGFVETRVCKINESPDPEFQNLENASRMPEGFLQLETMTLEAGKSCTTQLS